MKIVLTLSIEGCDFIIMYSREKFRLIQIPKSEHYLSCIEVYDTFDEAKKALFNSL